MSISVVFLFWVFDLNFGRAYNARKARAEAQALDEMVAFGIAIDWS